MYRDRDHKEQMRAMGAEIVRPQIDTTTTRLDAKSKPRENASKLLGKRGAGAMVHRPRGY